MRLCVFIVAIGKDVFYIYIYIIYSSNFPQLYTYINIYIYCARKKTNKLQVHPYRSVSWFPPHQGKSPDEWATTKQACRDELVVYLSFSSHNIYIALLLCIEHCFTKVKILHFVYIYICIYIFCFLNKKVMNGACMLHIKGTISLL